MARRGAARAEGRACLGEGEGEGEGEGWGWHGEELRERREWLAELEVDLVRLEIDEVGGEWCVEVRVVPVPTGTALVVVGEAPG